MAAFHLFVTCVAVVAAWRQVTREWLEERRTRRQIRRRLAAVARVGRGLGRAA